MGILGDIVNGVKDDAKYEISSGVRGGVRKIMDAFGKKDSSKPLSKCPKCKTKITDSSLKFCSNCGAKLTVSCSKCNVDYSYGTKFCTECGSKLK